jgi:hypothetical protein
MKYFKNISNRIAMAIAVVMTAFLIYPVVAGGSGTPDQVLSESDVLRGEARVSRFWEFTNALYGETNLPVNLISSGTVTALAGNGGGLTISGNATTDNSGAQVQYGTASITPVDNGVLQYTVRIQASSLGAEWLTGLTSVDTSLVASAPTDGIYLHKLEDVGTVNIVVVRDGTAVTQSAGSLALASTWQTFTFQVRSESSSRNATVVVYLDGIRKFSYRFTNIPDDAYLTEGVAAQSGSDVGTQTVSVDYIRVVGDRSDRD